MIYHDIKSFKKQRNYVVNLNKKANQSYLEGVYTNSKSFCGTPVNHCFQIKLIIPTIILLCSIKMLFITNEKHISNLFNNYFVNITKEIPIKPWLRSTDENSVPESLDEIDNE